MFQQMFRSRKKPNLLPWFVAILYERRPAHRHRHILGRLTILDEAVLDVVLLAVLFLYITKLIFRGEV